MKSSFNKESHASYFQDLQSKLLKESEHISTFMGKQIFTPHLTPQNLHKSKSKQHLKNIIAEKDSLEKSIHKLKELSKQKSIQILKDSAENRDTITTLTKIKQILKKEEPPRLQAAVIRKKQANICKKTLPRNQEKIQLKSHRIIKPYINWKEEFMKKTISTNYSKSREIEKQNSSQFGNLSIKDFEVIRFLEKGQFGSVFLAMQIIDSHFRHRNTNSICAIKRILVSFCQSNQKIKNQVMREIKIQSWLDHPNIVQMYGFFKEEESIFLVLQVCCSGNLYQLMRTRGRLAEDEVRSIMKQICHAVEYLHENDIIHRDIKLENILFHENIAKLCDFGWSVYSPLLRDTSCGTPVYSSPEIIERKNYDNKVDIWNIGIIAYELLYGRVPFEIRTHEDLFKVIHDEIYFPKTILASLPFKDFISKCLCKNFQERSSINKLMDHEFLNPIE